ncbi:MULTISPECIES: beta-L-arabinofuranosidase domain-containing protein [Mesorhizobium]|uniref:glycoside hydrolase family 127 protein n=1 Tax=Mesorhizobium TaxID=68287 RepID=UPI0007EDE799|nr:MULTISPECIES: beta-L-arabinofuranosidase domain-containing protein [Mesorhizobium]PBB54836.1 glycoside hydrolase family 127 protein [Mesorhizobium loti]QIA25122.1 glycoside hydrolase family 127 protein [Mesorhizobium sp. AA22]
MSEFKPVRFVDVALEGQFWRERLETVLTRTIPSQHVQLGKQGVLLSLTLPNQSLPLSVPGNEHDSGQVFWDSDAGKWIEAASYALSHRRDPDIEAWIENIVDDLERAQAPDGYLNCWYLQREPDKRWTNLRDNHELYNLGHLLEGGIAYFLATGRRRLLDILERYVDHVRKTFGPNPGQKRGYCGHQEIELALVKLYRLTGDRMHLDLAAYFMNERGRQPHYFDQEAVARGENPRDFREKRYEYNQSHRPVREQTKVVGHAVRAMYMLSAMAHLAAELNDDSLKKACEVLWADVISSKIYITSGLGPAAANEGFTEDHDLPNDTAYAETCASVGLIFWAHRMLHLELDGRYADVLEQALFNGALTGLSRDGERYFYSNPLESDGRRSRWAWHSCPCCTMNSSRLIASIGGYFVSASENAIAFHLYGGVSTNIQLATGNVFLRETSAYPFFGSIRIEVSPDAPAEFTINLRIPGWAHEAEASVGGCAVDVTACTRNGYLAISRLWNAGDTIALELPISPERIYAHPSVKQDIGRVALKRGPLVYCVEEVDNPGAPVQQLTLPRESKIETMERGDLFDGVVTLTASAQRVEDQGWGDSLYRNTPPIASDCRLTALPYYLWNNRAKGSMQVWLLES